MWPEKMCSIAPGLLAFTHIIVTAASLTVLRLGAHGASTASQPDPSQWAKSLLMPREWGLRLALQHHSPSLCKMVGLADSLGLEVMYAQQKHSSNKQEETPHSVAGWLVGVLLLPSSLANFHLNFLASPPPAWPLCAIHTQAQRQVNGK